ncbi:hypothetical protein WMY93_014752 [Mugilogobius chulae]|uniref:G-protein coupled receptors family 1 profile domain-containing protein n=1 Tax=Mugilogobius chulae TaxID=88201 RepID=A0AAW0P665_9GOBI
MDTLSNCSDFVLTCLCSGSQVGSFFLTAWFFSYMLFVPVFLFVLYLGYRRWKEHPRSAVSHSDVFTFHMIAEELLTALGSVMFTYSLYSGVNVAFELGMALCCLSFNGQLFFHSLTCVERYLAVVHPITYLRLKERLGVMIRNITLVRPGPGEKRKLSHSKKSAFYTIMAILTVLLLKEDQTSISSHIPGNK